MVSRDVIVTVRSRSGLDMCTWRSATEVVDVDGV